MRRSPALLSLAVVLAAPAAAAAATWSAPQNVSSAHEFVDSPGLVVSGDGTALASWTTGDGTGNSSLAGMGDASRAAGGAAFGASHGLLPRTRIDRRPYLGTGPVAYGRNGAILAVQRAVVRNPLDGRIRLAVRFGHTGGAFGAGRVVRVAKGIRSVSLAAAPSGAAALAWFEDRGVRTDRVYVSLRAPGGRFGAPRLLTIGRIRS
ncbi:MAG: hypothetical protein QOE28_2307, partial [Solirubrobacteraceae bacterium]|nr:hypothetical protein [Solirubrobacteraceae bacterium]